MENKNTPASYADFQTGEEPAGWMRTVVQFFAIPLLIVCVAVGLYLGINMMIGSGPETAEDYVRLLQSDTINRRWQAAYELAARLRGEVPPEFRDPQLVAALGSALKRAREEKQEPPRLAMLVLNILRRLEDPAGIEPARAALQDEHDWIRSYAILALAGMGDRDSIPEFRRLAGHREDPGTRQAALEGLVRLDQVDGLPFVLTSETKRIAQAHLGDVNEDVRFTAALVLADARDPAALPVLAVMLDRATLQTYEFDDTLGGLDRYQVHSNLIRRAIRAVVKLDAAGDPRIMGALELLTDDAKEGDSDVREDARRALDTLKRKD